MEIVFVIGGLALVLGGVGFWRGKSRKKTPPEKLSPVSGSPENQTLGDKLRKTREALFGTSQAFDLQALEESLLAGDVGAKTTELLLDRLRAQPVANGETPRRLIQTEMIKVLSVPHRNLAELAQEHKPLVIAIVGINGAGKTTSIGKLARYFKSQGKSVLLGAADTFRAGAIAQLQVWAERVGVDFVKGREGADPGAVAFDAVTAGKARGADVVILDTAGRLHTKSNLMDELKKIQKVIKKVIPDAPHETWLVLDGTLGQNSLAQAREFQQTLGLTGTIVTKLDGTAKGGCILPVTQELGVPVRFIGVGETDEDLIPFNPEQFVHSLLT
ncbi:signal recognition particle-docking protein FtsY [bacterium]|nr:signal recognition particle-docking protein FtsY [bacterium]